MFAFESMFQVALVASTWAMFVPQAFRSLRNGSVGVSSAGWAAVVAGRVIMLMYGLAEDDPAQLWSAAVPGALAALILARSVRGSSPAARRRVAGYGALVAVVGVASLVEPGSSVESVALVAAAVLSAVPHAIKAHSSFELQGVSGPAWVASFLSSCAWAAYGLVEGLVAVVVANLVWACASAVVAHATLWRRAPGSARCADAG